MIENQARVLISDICRKMWQLGWVAANDGNVSLKLNNGEFLVTPSGVSKGDISPEMLIKTDGQGRHETPLVNSGNVRVSSEFKMHLRCYSEREDVNAVIHAHSPCATAFAVTGKPLDDYCIMETALTIGSVPVAPYATPSTAEVGDAVAPFLQNHDVILLRNHGALAVGRDLVTAFQRMETLEHSAKIMINVNTLSSAVGADVKQYEISRENVERLCELREVYGLSGIHPGWRKYS